MKHKLTYDYFKYTTRSQDDVLNTPENSYHGYYRVCDIDYMIIKI